MAQRKRGPGRPKWVVKRQEVQHSEESAEIMAWWQSVSGEENGGSAIRRALVVLATIGRRGHVRVLRRALKETER